MRQSKGQRKSHQLSNEWRLCSPKVTINQRHFHHWLLQMWFPSRNSPMPRSTGSNLLTYRVHSANIPSSVKACSKEARGIRNTVPRNHVISQIPELHSSGNHLLVLAKGNFPTRRSVAVIIQGQRTSKPSAYLNVLIINCLLRFYRDKCTHWPPPCRVKWSTSTCFSFLHPQSSGNEGRKLPSRHPALLKVFVWSWLSPRGLTEVQNNQQKNCHRFGSGLLWLRSNGDIEPVSSITIFSFFPPDFEYEPYGS